MFLDCSWFSLLFSLFCLGDFWFLNWFTFFFESFQRVLRVYHVFFYAFYVVLGGLSRFQSFQVFFMVFCFEFFTCLFFGSCVDFFCSDLRGVVSNVFARFFDVFILSGFLF